jgi:hypothetical protein
VKTRLYFGAPLGQDCLNFKNFGDVEKWLDDKAQARAGNSIGESMVGAIKRRCVCGAIGMDGTKSCYPPMHPHRHKIRLEASKSPLARDEDLVACDNHVQYYLGKDWKLMAKLCCYCCVAEATVDDGCEGCLDKMTAPTGGEAYRLKKIESGYCLNRDNLLGCITYAEPGTQYCTFCKTRNFLAPADLENKMGKRHPSAEAPRAKIRLIPASSRTCTLTPSCAGTMTAAVHRADNDKSGPHLWWTCKTCGVSQKALRAAAKPSSSALATLLDGGDETDPRYGPEPINAEMAEAAAHVKAIILESSGE